MSTEKETLGKLGENLACEFLKEKGYKIIERNYRQPWGELDIIARSPEKILVFVEVKTVKDFGPVTAEEHLTQTKLKRLQRTANLYANSSKFLTNKGWRIDLIAISGEREFDLRHYENV